MTHATYTSVICGGFKGLGRHAAPSARANIWLDCVCGAFSGTLASVQSAPPIIIIIKRFLA